MDQTTTKSLYRQLKHLQAQFDAHKGWFQPPLIQETYHSLIDELTQATGRDCSKFKVPSSAYTEVNRGQYIYNTLAVRSSIGMAVGFVEDMLNISEESNLPKSTHNSVTVINQNTIAVNITNTIEELIAKSSDKGEREKLTELDEELNKPKKDWGKIKSILIWILNFSKDLFIQILPELLKKYGG